MNGRWLPQDRRGWVLLVVGVLALVACVFFGMGHQRQAWLAYLVAYLFVLGLALGSMAMIMVHALTGGAWGFVLRPQLLATTRTLPLLALGLLPLLWAAPWLFPWMQAASPNDPDFARQSWYLNRIFFSVRAVVFMALWLWLAAWLRRCLRESQRLLRLRRWAVIGIIVYVVSASLFGVDWIMALQPRWHSSTFGLTFITAQMLAATAWAAAWVARERPPCACPDAASLSDIGKLLLMFVLAFAYLAFMDYLTAWSGNLPSETVWYVPRTLTSWKWLAAFVIVFELIVPFAALLSRRRKTQPGSIRAIAIALLAAHLAYVLWLVLPAGRAAGVHLYWTDLLALIGVGALWWLVCVYGVATRVQRSATDPRGVTA